MLILKIKNKKILISELCIFLCLGLFLLQPTTQTNKVFGQEETIKDAISDISVHITEAIKSYAMAIGEKYFEVEHDTLDVNTSAIAQATGTSEGKLIDAFSYSAAQNHLKTGELLFIDIIPTIKNSYPEDIIQIQSGLLMLKNLFNYKSSYNLVEDVGFGMVLSHLDNIYKQQ